jgi:hypothetical protein
MGPTLQLANATYARIRSLAVRDAQLWATGIDIDRGYQQIVSEYIPVRYHLLLKCVPQIAHDHPIETE